MMLKFLIKLPFRILFLPILLALKILFWMCSGVLCMSEWMFSLAGTVLFLLGLYSVLFEVNPQGWVVMGIAFLVSPFGIPMLTLKVVLLVGVMGDFIQDVVY